MSLGRFAPCVNCTCTQGGSCVLFTDTFSDLTNWTVDAGTWVVEGNKAKCTTPNGKITSVFIHTANTFSVSFNITAYNENDCARVYFNGGAYYFEFQFGTQYGLVRLVEAGTGNIYTEQVAQLAINQQTYVAIVADNGTITGYYNVANNASAFASYKLTLTSSVISLGTAAVTSNIKFGEFKVTKTKSEDSKCTGGSDICSYGSWPPKSTSAFDITKTGWDTTWTFDGNILSTTAANAVATYKVKHPGDPDSVAAFEVQALCSNVTPPTEQVIYEFPEVNVRVVQRYEALTLYWNRLVLEFFVNDSLITSIYGIQITVAYGTMTSKFHFNFDANKRLIFGYGGISAYSGYKMMGCGIVTPPLSTYPTQLRIKTGPTNTQTSSIYSLKVIRQNAVYSPTGASYTSCSTPTAIWAGVPSYYGVSLQGATDTTRCTNCSMLNGYYICVAGLTQCSSLHGTYVYNGPTSTYVCASQLRITVNYVAPYLNVRVLTNIANYGDIYEDYKSGPITEADLTNGTIIQVFKIPNPLYSSLGCSLPSTLTVKGFI